MQIMSPARQTPQITPTSALTCAPIIPNALAHATGTVNRFVHRLNALEFRESSQLAARSPRRHLNAAALAARLRLAPSTERE
jgi:hypothetical protein